MIGIDLNLTYWLHPKLLLAAPELGGAEVSVLDLADGLPLYGIVLVTGSDSRRVELGQYWLLPNDKRIPDVCV